MAEGTGTWMANGREQRVEGRGQIVGKIETGKETNS
jgi:hypothetical protein